jgi:hypothetical protein
MKLLLSGLFILLVSCVPQAGRLEIKNHSPAQFPLPSLNSSNGIILANDKITLKGVNLDQITKVEIKGSGIDTELPIVSKNNQTAVVSASSAITLALNATFELILSSANAATPVVVMFNLVDGSVSGSKLSSMGASTGQVLKFNGTSWAPGDLGALIYAGTWDATTGIAPNATPVGGEYYIVSVAQTNVDLYDGNGSRNWGVGDWIIFNGDSSSWDKVDNASFYVTSFNGRKGIITPASGDYTWGQINKTTSSINDIADVDTTGVGVGSVLRYDGSQWVIDNDVSSGGDISGDFSVDTSTLFVDSTNNRVGIGTATPAATLQTIPSGTISGSGNMAGAGVLVGTTGTGIGIDSNEITQKGDHLYLSAQSNDIIFRTDTNSDGNADNSMVLKKNGYLGIGTDTPAAALEVASGGTSATYGLNQTPSLILGKNNATNPGAIKMWGVTSNAYSTLQTTTGNLHLDSSSGSTGVYLNHYNSGGFVDIMAGKIRAISSGNFGIGTISPSTRLEVRSTGIENSSFSISSGDTRLRLGRPGTAADDNAIIGWNDSLKQLQFYISGDNAGAGLNIANGGSVGIGITAPGSYPSPSTLDVHSESHASLAISSNAGSLSRLALSSNSQNWLIDNVGSFVSPNNRFRILEPTAYSEVLTILPTSGSVGIGVSNPKAKLHVKNGGEFDGSGGNLLHIKNTSSSYSNGDPYVTNTSDLGLMYSISDATTSGPTQPGLVLYNNDATAGGWSPMLLFAKKESDASAYQTTLAGIYAKSPLGTGNGGSWIDGELHFATAGAATLGIKSRMVINKEGNVGIGTTDPKFNLHLVGTSGAAGLSIDSGYNTGTSTLYFSHMPTNTGQHKAGILAPSAGQYGRSTGLFFSLNGVNDSSNITTTDSKFTILENGNIGVGTNSPSYGLQIAAGKELYVGAAGNKVYLGDVNNWMTRNASGYTQFSSPGGFSFDYYGTSRVKITSDGSVGIGTTTPGTKLQVGENGDGTVATANAWNTFSDRRLKKDFEQIQQASEIIAQLNGYFYYWKNGSDKSRQVGVIAQEVEAVLPELVKETSDGIKTVDYPKLTAVLIEATKEQGRKISSLEEENKLLKERLERLEAIILKQ